MSHRTEMTRQILRYNLGRQDECPNRDGKMTESKIGTHVGIKRTFTLLLLHVVHPLRVLLCKRLEGIEKLWNRIQKPRLNLRSA